MENETPQSHIIIMKQLSDIDRHVAVTSSEIGNIKDRLKVIQDDTKESVTQSRQTNGRVTKLEDWSAQAQKVIESTTKIANGVAEKYTINQTKLWTAIGVLVFLGGTIITLAIMAINSKIKDGIDEAISERGLTDEELRDLIK